MECQLRNEFLGAAAGELPPLECWPELWLVNAGDEARARALMTAIRNAPKPAGGEWVCPECRAPGEAGFDVCWNCGADRPQS